MTSYNEFVKQQFKKRPKNVSAKDYMKTIAKRWKKTKKGGAITGGIPLPPVPLGVVCYFSETDLSPLEEHGFGIFDGMKKAYNKAKQALNIPRKRQPGDLPLRSLKGSNAPNVPYYSVKKVQRDDGEYYVVQIQLYYSDNPAIGVGWELAPRSKFLGYHDDDLELFQIYYDTNWNPIKTYWAHHSIGSGDGEWVDYKDCEFEEGCIVCYVARNSHACYPHNEGGVHYRVYLLANDHTDKNPAFRAKYLFKDMNPGVSWDNGHGISMTAVNDVKVPPDFQKTPMERIFNP